MCYLNNVDNRIHFCISVAGHTVSIDALYTEVKTLCDKYICDLPPEIYIQSSEKDIKNERLAAKKEKKPYKDSYLETLVLYRMLSEELLSFNTFLMHGAVVAVNSKAYMFTANSGTGKTTHVEKWLKNIDGAFIVNGDKPLIQVNDKNILACGTPWCGKEHMGTNIMVPLDSIILMERAEYNKIEKITFGQAFPALLEQTHRPLNGSKMKKTLELLSGLNGRVGLYRFEFNNFREDSFDVAYNSLINRSCG